MVVLGFTIGIFLLMVALSNEATSQYINEAVAKARRVDQGQVLHGQVYKKFQQGNKCFFSLTSLQGVGKSQSELRLTQRWTIVLFKKGIGIGFLSGIGIGYTVLLAAF